MTKNERTALLTYLDSQVMMFCKSIENHLDADAVGTLYDNAHYLLQDLEDVLAVDAMLKETTPVQLPVKRKST